MAWPNDDLARRSSVAKELDRQSFWKDAFKIAFSHGITTVAHASECADEALRLFDEKFSRQSS